jgi:hypothetical protein
MIILGLMFVDKVGARVFAGPTILARGLTRYKDARL